MRFFCSRRISRCYQPTYWLFASEEVAIEVIHKPCGHLSGEGVMIMIILLHKPYLVKVTTKVERGGKNTHNIDHAVYKWPHIHETLIWLPYLLFLSSLLYYIIYSNHMQEVCVQEVFQFSDWIENFNTRQFPKQKIF